MPSGVFKRPSLEERFWAKVKKTDTCWLWMGSHNGLGYGRIKNNKKSFYTHRYSYELHKKKIPAGLVIDHLCQVPACVNPDHLEVVTQKENILRGNGPAAISVRTNSCWKGHKFTKENTYLQNGKRVCKICRYNKHLEWKKNNKDRFKVYQERQRMGLYGS